MAILFDLDRTLVDLQGFTDYAAALSDLRMILGESREASVPEADWDAPTMSVMAILVGLSGDPRWAEASQAVARHEFAAIAESRAMAGLSGVVKACGHLPYAVVTLLPVDVARAVLEHHGFPVDVIVGRDPEIRAKPHGDGLVRAADLLGVRVEDSVMIGDSSWDLAAAMDAGASFIGVPFGEGSFPDEVQAFGDLLAAIRAAH